MLPQDKFPPGQHQTVELFQLAPQRPGACPVCNAPIKWATVAAALITREVALNPLPVPASIASYRQLEDQPGMLELAVVAKDAGRDRGPFYVAHEKTCTRCPF